MKSQEASLQVYEKKTLPHMLPHILCLVFLRTQHDSSDEALKMCEKNLFKKYKQKVVLFVKFTCSITIHQSQLLSCWMWDLNLSWVQFLSSTFLFLYNHTGKLGWRSMCLRFRNLSLKLRLMVCLIWKLIS